jgi:hypothetical protein
MLGAWWARDDSAHACACCVAGGASALCLKAKRMTAAGMPDAGRVTCDALLKLRATQRHCLQKVHQSLRQCAIAAQFCGT